MEEILNSLKTKISNHREIYNRNEAAVRTQLIEPLLRNLGWHTDDPNYVDINSQMEGGEIPDYTIIFNKNIVTYIEAKKMSENIEKHMDQLAKYCLKEGKEYGLLTNGNDWMLVKTFEVNVPLRNNIIWKVSIENDDISQLLSKFTTINYSNINQLSELIQNNKQLEQFWLENSSNDVIIDKFANELALIFSLDFPKNHNSIDSCVDFFKLKLKSILNTENSNKIEEIIYKPIKTEASNNIVNSNRAKIINDWIKTIPELKHYSNIRISSWQELCTKLGIAVEGDSARRRLDKYVKENKPYWTPLP